MIKEAEIERTKSFKREVGNGDIYFQNKLTLEEKLWEESNFDSFVESIKEIVGYQKIVYSNLDESAPALEAHPFTKVIMGIHALNSSPFGEPLIHHLEEDDFYLRLRLILECFDSEDIVHQDLTYVHVAGYCEDLFNDWDDHTEKILVITEGKTDASYIRRSIDSIFPHVSNIYSFLDFESKARRPPGSIGAIINLTKSLMSAKIKGKVVCIFDNDTSGVEGYNALTSSDPPPNFKILKYPDIISLNNYPTLGPTGLFHMNINGLAASIELYFGDDCLILNGTKTPIQWKGYNVSMKQYQGSLIDKKSVQDNIERKLSTLKPNTPINKEEWATTIILLQHLFKAFRSPTYP